MEDILKSKKTKYKVTEESNDEIKENGVAKDEMMEVIEGKKDCIEEDNKDPLEKKEEESNQGRRRSRRKPNVTRHVTHKCDEEEDKPLNKKEKDENNVEQVDEKQTNGKDSLESKKKKDKVTEESHDEIKENGAAKDEMMEVIEGKKDCLEEDNKDPQEKKDDESNQSRRRSRRKPNVTRHVTHKCDEKEDKPLNKKEKDETNVEQVDEKQTKGKVNNNDKNECDSMDISNEDMKDEHNLEESNEIKEEKEQTNLLKKNGKANNNREKEEEESESEKSSDSEKQKDKSKKKKKEGLLIQTNSEGVSTLEDGTIVVQPESASENEFKGPEFRKKRNKGTDSDVVRCTSCNTQLNPDIKGKLHEHPSLKVLICRKCYNFYTSGSFTKDEDDIDEQCHWCGEGGKLICCDFCCKVFCRSCILRNLGREELSGILNADDDYQWKCYGCEPFQLADLQQLCSSVLHKKTPSKNPEVGSDMSRILLNIKKHADYLSNELKPFKGKKFKPPASEFVGMETRTLKTFVRNLNVVMDVAKSLQKQVLNFLVSLSSDDSDEPEWSDGDYKKERKRKKKSLQNGSLNHSKRFSKSPRKLKTTLNHDSRKALCSKSDESSDICEIDQKSKGDDETKESVQKETSEMNGKISRESDDSSSDSELEFELNKEKSKSKRKNRNKGDKQKDLSNESSEEAETLKQAKTDKPKDVTQKAESVGNEDEGDRDKEDDNLLQSSDDDEEEIESKKEDKEKNEKDQIKKDGEEVLSSEEEKMSSDSDDEKVKIKKEIKHIKTEAEQNSSDSDDEKEKLEKEKEHIKTETDKGSSDSDDENEKIEREKEHIKTETDKSSSDSDDDKEKLEKEREHVKTEDQNSKNETSSEEEDDSDDSLLDIDEKCKQKGDGNCKNKSKKIKKKDVRKKECSDKVEKRIDKEDRKEDSQSDSSIEKLITNLAKKNKKKPETDESDVEKTPEKKDKVKKKKSEREHVKTEDQNSTNETSSEEEDDSDDSLLDIDEKRKKKGDGNCKNNSKKIKKKDVRKKECSDKVEKRKDKEDRKEDSQSDSSIEKLIANLAKRNKKKKPKPDESDVEKTPEKKDKVKKKKSKSKKTKNSISDLEVSSSDLSDDTEQRRKHALEAKEKDGSDQEMIDLEPTDNGYLGSDISDKSDVDVDEFAEKLVLAEIKAEEAAEGVNASDECSGDEDKQKDKKKKTKEKSKKEKEDRNASEKKDESDSDGNNKKKKKKSEKSEKDEDDDDEEKEESSEEETEESSEEETDSDDTKKKKKRKAHRLMQVILRESSDSSDEDNQSKREKRANRRAQMLKRKRKQDNSSSTNSSSDSDTKGKRGKRKKLNSNNSETSSDDSVGKKKSKGKKSKRKNSEDSTSEEMESSEEKIKQKKKRRRRKKDGESSQTSGKEETGRKRKKRRRRIKLASDSSKDSDEEDEKEKKVEDPDTPSKSKRRNIRKVMKDSKLKQETKAAAQLELERRKRVAEKRKEVIDENEDKPKESSKVTACVLEYDKKKKDKVVLEVDKAISKNLKPHQVKGIQFLWDSTYENMDKIGDDGGGCILAHCMGLGKTLQVISYIHTVMSSEEIGAKHCLVVAPLNTVLNWVNEFDKWLGKESEIPVYEMSSIKDNYGRADTLRFWHKNGGVMIIGYSMYRNLATGARIRKKSQKKTFSEALTDPGPDIVVCDEGHMLKNEQTVISKALNQIKTRRRICLTGTPLQNNLIEYHCMVDFVKPSLLGTKKEFCNRFVNPITNGQSSDASRHDVRVMKRRAHVLHEMLSGCVQRRDYSALANYLPPKHEYVVSVRLSKVQMELYEKYLNSYARSQNGENQRMGLFADYQALMRIWTHPWVLRLSTIRDIKKARYDDEMSDFITSGEELASDDSLVEFIDDNKSKEKEWRNSGCSDSEDELIAKAKRKQKGGKSDGAKSDSSVEVVNTWKTRSRARNTRSGAAAAAEEPELVELDQGLPGDDEWYSTLVPEDCKNNLDMSGKLLLLMEILKLAEMVGDKVLVFSQSLLSLDLIEDFLQHIEESEPQEDSEEIAGTGSWVKGVDYFRMDGSTAPQMRARWADIFNDPDDLRSRLFLISTRAGSLGTNLVAANRVILFDASWNPSHDIQSIFRVYRFGQTKAVYVYRLVAQGTMEEKIYERQVTKQSLSQRVVDEHQIERHFTSNDLSELYNFTPDRLDDPNRPERPTPTLPKDFVLAELLKNQADWIVKYHEHDSLLENKIAEELTEEERKEAWKDYEAEKEGRVQFQIHNMQPGVAGVAAANAQFMQQYGHLYQQGHNTLLTGQRILNPILQQQYARTAQQSAYTMPSVHELNQQRYAVQQNLLAMQAAIAETQRKQQEQQFGTSVSNMFSRMRNLASSSTSSGPTIVEIIDDDDDPPAGNGPISK